MPRPATTMGGKARSRRERVPPVGRGGPPVLHDLLEEKTLGITTTSGERVWVSLPEALELLGRDEIRAFSGLQAHQQHAWHAFLVQLAAIALHRARQENPKRKAADWRDLLLALTEQRHEPWCLVVEDLSRPAFMQPPVPEGTLAGFKEYRQPDRLDVPVTAKNHDVKAARVALPRPEHWVYALVSVQTMGGYSGSGNYGVARMNSGYGSRPGLGLAPGLMLGERFKRDTSVVLISREEILGRVEDYAAKNGVALLWLDPWTGVKEKGLGVGDLDPLFIEVCRRLRLAVEEGRIVARKGGTEGTRVSAAALNGNTGDPWTPVLRAEGKAFTATGEGFSYRVIQRLLSDDYVPGAAMAPGRAERDLVLIGQVLARGEGETAGFHERLLPVPAKVTGLFRQAEGRKKVAELAAKRVETVAIVQRKVLNPAVLTLVQGAPENKLNFKDERAAPWLKKLDRTVDAVFFERLWADLGRDEERAHRDWARLVLDFAKAELRDAIESAPVPEARRYRAIAEAEAVFEGAARRNLSIAYEQEGRP